MKKINLFLLFVLPLTIYSQKSFNARSPDTTKSNWDYFIGLDTYYFLPMGTVEITHSTSELGYTSLQLSSILVLYDLGIRQIYKSSNNPGLFYGIGTHGMLDILVGTELFVCGIVGYEWKIFQSTRIGLEVRRGLIWSKEERFDKNGDPWIYFGARIRW